MQRRAAPSRQLQLGTLPRVALLRAYCPERCYWEVAEPLRVGAECEVSRVTGDSPLEGIVESGVFLSFHSYYETSSSSPHIPTDASPLPWPQKQTYDSKNDYFSP